MRGVAGTAGGRRLRAPAGRGLRPTTERVREAVFSSLTSLGAVEGARVLDLFAGTGALGIEALSRGAETATFVESDPTAVAAIKANLDTTGLAGRASVVRNDVLRFLAGEASEAEAFDVAFVDPPYDFASWVRLLERLPATLAVLESGAAVDPGPELMTLRSRRHGDTVVTFTRRN